MKRPSKRHLALVGALGVTAASAIILGSYKGAFALTSGGGAAVTDHPGQFAVAPQNPQAKPTPQPSIASGIATFTDTAALAQLAAACAATATPNQAGAVILQGGLKDQHTTVTFTVPCAVQLPGTASVKLNDVTVTSQTLNFSDTAFGPGDNNVQFSNVTFKGGSAAGFLVELSDPADNVQMETATLTYPSGIVIQARGGRTDPDSGGSVALHHANLVSQGPDSAGITVVASTSKGLIQANNTVFNADQIALVADQCSVEVAGNPVDCRASTLGADLKNQAQQADAHR